MSIKMDVKSPNKGEMARILRAFADLVEVASNETVTVTVAVTFDLDKEAEG